MRASGWSRILGYSGAAFGLAACDPELPQYQRTTADAGVHVRFEPAAPEYGTPAFRARWRGISRPPYPRLFSGELSLSQRARARALELPSTLEERRVPLFTYESGRDQTAVVLGRVRPGAYELQLGAGDWLSFEAAEPSGTWFQREWPVSQTSAGIAVYCIMSHNIPVPTLSALSVEPAAVTLWPRGDARFELIDDRCLSLSVESAPSSGAVTPLDLEGWPLEPTVFRPPEAGPPLAVGSCAAGFRPLASGCAQLLDDRLIIDGPAFNTYWIFRGAVALTRALAAGERTIVSGILPGLRQSVELAVLDQYGRQVYARPSLEPGEVLPHIVINEVMANPLGPEPAQEWVELYNDGTEPVDLEGFRLGDNSHLAELPRATVDPQRFVLVVPQEFDALADWDVVPEENTPLIRVPRLGGGGLSNSGESLRLLSPSGSVISLFPADPKPGAGNSVARRMPWSVDGLNGSFGLHAFPGASPGGENVVP